MNKTSTFSYILTKLTATFFLLLLISTLLLTTSQPTLYSFLAGLRELLYFPSFLSLRYMQFLFYLHR